MKASLKTLLTSKRPGGLPSYYDAILEANYDWIGRDHTHELDLFMTRMLFCFFAENTSIFDNRLFSTTVILPSRG